MVSRHIIPRQVCGFDYFIGTAIYVYGILSNADNNPSGNADQLFFIDGQPSHTFTHTPSGDGSFVYDYVLYANTGLPNGRHTVKMQNGQPGDLSSLILLDKFIYTAYALRYASENHLCSLCFQR